ncbi:MAG: hypothetical protein HY904_16135 [Deltaproteobacteria bacterium]|nr:hypothetical protein [Deltaproteobacteria bacterium]
MVTAAAFTARGNGRESQAKPPEELVDEPPEELLDELLDDPPEELPEELLDELLGQPEHAS